MNADQPPDRQPPALHPTMILRFAGFQLDLETEELSRAGELLPLAPQPSRVLALLVDNAGRTVTREEIQRHVWGDEHVEADVGLNSCIKKIRAQLDDDPRSPRFIRTVPRRGYRFIAAVERTDKGHEAGSDAQTSQLGRRMAAAGAVLVLVLVIGVGLLVSKASPSARESAARISLAVLGFETLVGSSEASNKEVALFQ